MSGGRNAMIAKLAGGAALAVALSGCVQATRHSNAIVFGTNTSLGVNVGTGAASVPAINIGYSRQEAVFLPLLANTREASEIVRSRERQFGALQPMLSPCNIDPTNVAAAATVRRPAPGAPIPAPAQTPLTPEQIREFSQSASLNPCLFVARELGTNGEVTRSDAYSVLASFGGRAGGTDGDVPNATIGIAQYFSTGVAAQILAKSGGAGVTTIGQPGTERSGKDGASQRSEEAGRAVDGSESEGEGG